MTTFKKLMISIPVVPNGSISHELTKWLLETQRGVDGWDVAIDIVPIRPVAAGRNEQIRRFLWQSGCDVLLSVDDDMAPGMDGLKLLLKYIERDDVDVVSALTLRKDRSGPQPVVIGFSDDFQQSGMHKEILSKPPGLHKVNQGGVPGACIMAKRDVFKRFYDAKRVWHKDVLQDGSMEHHELVGMIEKYRNNPDSLYNALNVKLNKMNDFHRDVVGYREWGHDMWFCRQCIDLDISVWIDTSILWGHIKSIDLRQWLTTAAQHAHQEKRASRLEEMLRTIEPQISHLAVAEDVKELLGG